MSIQDSILDILKIWLPFVEVKDIQITNNNSNELRVVIVFNIVQDPNTLNSVAVTFSGDINDNN